MGFGGISIWQLLILLVIVVLIFGTKKLKNTGGDLGSAIKNFKKAMTEDSSKTDEEASEQIEETAQNVNKQSDDVSSDKKDA